MVHVGVCWLVGAKANTGSLSIRRRRAKFEFMAKPWDVYRCLMETFDHVIIRSHNVAEPISSSFIIFFDQFPWMANTNSDQTPKTSHETNMNCVPMLASEHPRFVQLCLLTSNSMVGFCFDMKNVFPGLFPCFICGFHYSDKKVWWQSNLDSGNHYTDKTVWYCAAYVVKLCC